MNRIINNPDRVVEEAVAGYLRAHPDIIAGTGNARVIKAANAPVAGKVGVVTGGGSGHEPAFLGYAGEGLCDAIAIGEIFSSPPAQAFYEAFKAADGGQGVACLFGNYAGDTMNVRMAIRMAARDGITVKTVIADDDVASAPPDQRAKRRGVAGEILMWKAGGAKAAQGGSLDEVIAAAQKAIDRTRSLGIGLAPCTIPAVGKPNFSIRDGEMEVGIGHHGEPGVEVRAIATADEMAEIMVGRIVPDLPFERGDEVAVLVSGLGATPVMELYILYDRIAELLGGQGISVVRPYVGNYFTSLDMMGATLTVLKLDAELKALLDHPARSIGWR